MNSHVHPIFADILNSFAATPAKITDAQALEIDLALLADKKADGRFQRSMDEALRLQISQGDH